jgi:hypothetical protein
MISDIVERRIKEVEKRISINSYRAASGILDANQIGLLSERELKGALFLIRLKKMVETGGNKVETVTKYTIGGC